MKLVAMSPKYYFQVGWNVFDFIIGLIIIAQLVHVLLQKLYPRYMFV